MSATVRAVVYREAPDQMDALADADARMDEIVTAVEAAVAPAAAEAAPRAAEAAPASLIKKSNDSKF
jgi:hypothetical protein